MNIIAFRLESGADLRKEIEARAAEAGMAAAFVLTCVGGLSTANLRMPGAQKHLDIMEDLEIVSLAGTVGPDGSHLHGAFSTIDGNVVGGHVSDGCVVRLTAEVVIGSSSNLIFRRHPDAATGFDELNVQAS